MRLFVGQAALRGAFGAYRDRFNLLELRAQASELPRISKLKEWRAAAPKNFAFSLLLSNTVGLLDMSPAATSELDYALKVSTALSASWVVLQTPAAVAPGARTRRALETLCERLKAFGARVAWDPRGVWEAREAEVLARALDLHLVRDLSRNDAPEGPVVYTRLRALGASARVSSGAVETVAERLEGCDEACVVLEGSGAIPAAQLLRQCVLEAENLVD